MARPLTTARCNDQLPQELLDLRGHLDKLPGSWREKLVGLCERVSQFARLQSRLVQIAQDAVDQLQLDNKYLLFDLEATRRERDELKEILEALEEDGE